MLRYLSFVVLLLAALLVACQQASNGQKVLSEAERAAIEQAVVQRVNKLIDLAEKLDTAWITSMMVKKGDVRMGNQVMLYKSADEILAFFGPLFKRFRSQEREIGSLFNCTNRSVLPIDERGSTGGSSGLPIIRLPEDQRLRQAVRSQRCVPSSIPQKNCT